MELNNKSILGIILFFLFFTSLTIIFNIPVFRQIFGFLFLSILPGFLILYILKLHRIEKIHVFVLSVGLSMTIVLLFGLFFNNISLFLGYNTPLQMQALLIFLNSVYLSLAFIGYTINKDRWTFNRIDLSFSEKLFLIPPFLFVTMSMLGIHLLNTFDINWVILALFLSIALYITAIGIFHNRFSKRLYPAVLLLISLSIVLLLALRSNHLIGSDIHAEFYLFSLVTDNMHWAMYENSLINACLSVTLLPALYQILLEMQPELLFKLLFPVLFSISPLVIFAIVKNYVDEIYAFFAAILFISQPLFLYAELNTRTVVAILFFLLSIFVLFHKEISIRSKKVLVVLFMASAVVSHYSTAYIFFGIFLGTWVAMKLVSRKYPVKNGITLDLILIFFALMYVWYAQLTVIPWTALSDFLSNTFLNLNRFFIIESRGGAVQTLLGGEVQEEGLAHAIQFGITWITFGVIGIGLLYTIFKVRTISMPEDTSEKSDYLNEKLDVSYVVLAFISLCLLASMIFLPFIAEHYALSRAYPFGLAVLAVFFIIGGIFISDLSSHTPLRKGSNPDSWPRGLILILVIILISFLSYTGVFHTLLGAPAREIILHSEGIEYDLYFVHDTETSAGKWLNPHTSSNSTIIVEEGGATMLMSQGLIPKQRIRESLSANSGLQDYAFLRYVNIIDGKMRQSNTGEWQVITNDHWLFDEDLIYYNGGSKIMK